MVRTYITQDYLKGYIPNLESLLWQEQADFSEQKRVMETEIMNDFINRGLKAVYLRNDLVLRSSGTAITTTTTEDVSLIDSITRQRFVIDVKSIAGSNKTITLKGCESEKGTFKPIESFRVTVNDIGIQSLIIPKFYNYYKVVCTVSDGSIDYESFLTETSYDILQAYKWICIILTPQADNSDGHYSHLFLKFSDKYNEMWNTLKIFYDSSESGNSGNIAELDNSVITLTR